ncbi:putative triacylglycerol lipase [Lupinus albus]|uniref:Putative triacylglycerol lipase n=1 Tax=Lupinus albus TaxID=3870 RepID=A0A6A4R395_LUPAL|nr:putative triacylglycerol lipase [Lupinus albus]
MGLLGLWGFVPFILCFLVLAYVPYQTHASSRSSISRKNLVLDPSLKGLCASVVIGHGYKCHELEVTTKDGYILSLQRIPEGRYESGGIGTKKQPVIIQHGVLVDGMTWFMNSPEQNLPMILADSGFDVWIVNSRGTRYSRRHISLDPSSEEFWNWCLDDLVSYDLTAVFDFVYNQTDQKIHYVGHSLGTLMALTSFSERQLVHQVKSAALLSPVAFLSHMKTALVVLAARSLLSETFTLLRVAEFNPTGVLVKGYVRSICAFPGVDCDDLLGAITGIPKLMN